MHNTSANTHTNDTLPQANAWHGGEIIRNTNLTHATTGFSELDQLLPGGGWPLAALTELYHAQPGIGELRLLMPALARLSRQGRWIAIIAPPFIPYAPALAAFGLDLSHVLLVHPKSPLDGLGALEQGLRSGTCGAVLAWPKQIDRQALQRLQLAAEAGRTWGILFRDPACQSQASPAALRLRLESRNGDTAINVSKCRDNAAGVELVLDLSRHASLTPAPAAAEPAPDANSELTPPLPPHPWPHAPSRSVKHPRRQSPARQPDQTQLDLPLASSLNQQPPLRQDKPGILTWRWRK